MTEGERYDFFMQGANASRVNGVARNLSWSLTFVRTILAHANEAIAT